MPVAALEVEIRWTLGDSSAFWCKMTQFNSEIPGGYGVCPWSRYLLRPACPALSPGWLPSLGLYTSGGFHLQLKRTLSIYTHTYIYNIYIYTHTNINQKQLVFLLKILAKMQIGVLIPQNQTMALGYETSLLTILKLTIEKKLSYCIIFDRLAHLLSGESYYTR